MWCVHGVADREQAVRGGGEGTGASADADAPHDELGRRLCVWHVVDGHGTVCGVVTSLSCADRERAGRGWGEGAGASVDADAAHHELESLRCVRHASSGMGASGDVNAA